MRIGIIFYLNNDNEKDCELLNWLNSQSNRSSFIKIKLYDCMIQEGGFVELKPKTKKEGVSDSFINSIIGLGG